MEKTVSIQLVCSNFPSITFGSRTPIYVGLQKKSDIVNEVPSNTKQATFTIPIQIKRGKDGNPDFRGPYVHGRVGDRFIYLVWFEKIEDTNVRFGRAKIKLSQLNWQHLQQDSIKAYLSMSDRKGCPVCATVPKDLIQWSITEPATS